MENSISLLRFKKSNYVIRLFSNNAEMGDFQKMQKKKKKKKNPAWTITFTIKFHLSNLFDNQLIIQLPHDINNGWIIPFRDAVEYSGVRKSNIRHFQFVMTKPGFNETES